MPAGLIKSKEDEKKWLKAKRIVQSSYVVKGKAIKNSDKYWAMVNGVYQKMKTAQGFMRGFVMSV